MDKYEVWKKDGEQVEKIATFEKHEKGSGGGISIHGVEDYVTIDWENADQRDTEVIVPCTVTAENQSALYNLAASGNIFCIEDVMSGDEGNIIKRNFDTVTVSEDGEVVELLGIYDMNSSIVSFKLRAAINNGSPEASLIVKLLYMG